MAPPLTQTHPSTRPSRLRCITIFILVIIVLLGLAILITWAAIKPRRFVYSIDDASIHGFDLTRNHLKANFNFELRAYNPNRKVSLDYANIEVRVIYKDQTLAFTTVEPFHQPRRNVTRLGLNQLEAKDVVLFGGSARDLRVERSTMGDMGVDVKVRAKVKYEVGGWKSRRRTLKLTCEDVRVPFSTSKNFYRTFCDVDW